MKAETVMLFYALIVSPPSRSGNDASARDQTGYQTEDRKPSIANGMEPVWIVHAAPSLSMTT